MKMMFFICCVALFTISATDACAQCETRHPQRHYCDADFAMKVKVENVSMASYRENLVTAEILSSWKKGPPMGIFKFLVDSSFCGTNFVPQQTFVVTGSKGKDADGSKYWRHGSCDFAALWEDMPGQQKIGFRKEYKTNCRSCMIHPTRSAYDLTVDELDNDYAEAVTFWTPTKCYYNPHKSQVYRQVSKGLVEDCEDEYGICGLDESGQCNWQLTPDYEECFRVRDDFVIVSSGQFAITDISQCDLLPNKRKRRNCRRRFKEEMAEEVLRF